MANTEPHKCTPASLFAQGNITEAEYLFLRGGSHTPEIFQRIEALSQRAGTLGVSGVFYSLEENQISPAKAMQVIRRYLLTGELEEYTRATGQDALQPAKEETNG